jgi:hypothetical protein
MLNARSSHLTRLRTSAVTQQLALSLTKRARANPAGEPCAEVLRSATRKGDLPFEPSTSLALAEQARYCDHDPGDKRREAREQ